MCLYSQPTQAHNPIHRGLHNLMTSVTIGLCSLQALPICFSHWERGRGVQLRPPYNVVICTPCVATSTLLWAQWLSGERIWLVFRRSCVHIPDFFCGFSWTYRLYHCFITVGMFRAVPGCFSRYTQINAHNDRFHCRLSSSYEILELD